MRGFVRRSMGCLLLAGVPVVLGGCKDALAPSGNVQVALAPDGGGAQAFAASVVAGSGAATLSLDDVESIDVTITRVEIQVASAEGESGWVQLPLSTSQAIDLLSLPVAGVQIAGGSVAAGTYGMVRLFFDDATLSLKEGVEVTVGQQTFSADDNPHPLLIPSGAETGVKIPTPGFQVESDTENVTVLFDDALSVQTVVATGNGLAMNPVLTAQVGG